LSASPGTARYATFEPFEIGIAGDGREIPEVRFSEPRTPDNKHGDFE
jgi:hypothetical protein